MVLIIYLICYFFFIFFFLFVFFMEVIIGIFFMFVIGVFIFFYDIIIINCLIVELCIRNYFNVKIIFISIYIYYKWKK